MRWSQSANPASTNGGGAGGVHDAALVALAEALDAILLTGDHRLAGAAGPLRTIEILSTRN